MENTPPPAHEDKPGGDESSALKRAVSEFVAARIELAAIETKEAAEFAVRKAVMAVTVALCVFFVWILVMAGLTGLLDAWAEKQFADQIPGVPGWVIILFALAALHAIVAIILALLLKKKPATQLYELTRQEMENDKAWVKSNK